MKILFITIENPKSQGDFLEVSLLHGLRSVLGQNCVDSPRKKIMYHDFSESPKESLHGKGFSLLTDPIEEIIDRTLKIGYDVILFGDGHIYGENERERQLCDDLGITTWSIDGHDLYGNAPNKIIFENEEIIGTQFDNCFKRELTISNHKNVFPTGFGIPKARIRGINTNKTQFFQKTAPQYALFGSNEIAGFNHHKFTNEEDYYNDLSQSWFGLTCKKGGWDCLRHYEIMAAGACLLFRDYNKKPPLCSPQEMPCFNYSTKQELDDLIHGLIINNKPTNDYIRMIENQRSWLNTIGTTESRARYIINTIQNHKD